MNKLEEQISRVFLMHPLTIMSIKEDGIFSYLVRGSNTVSIAIPFKFDFDINQDFVGLKVHKSFLNYENHSFSALCITANEDVNVDKFALVAADFINVDNRRNLLIDPFGWIDKWRSLFGDSLKKKRTYDVLGELISLLHVYNSDKSVVWMGPKSGSHDIVGISTYYEVKTTALKSDSIVTINNAYQLSEVKTTTLLFVRLEKKPYCLTINNLVNSLVEIGYSRESLEENLNNVGYTKGDRARDESYDLLSLLSYEVNKESFPIITVEDMNKLAPKKNITSYTLSLDISSIPHSIIFEKR